MMLDVERRGRVRVRGRGTQWWHDWAGVDECDGVGLRVELGDGMEWREGRRACRRGWAEIGVEDELVF